MVTLSLIAVIAGLSAVAQVAAMLRRPKTQIEIRYITPELDKNGALQVSVSALIVSPYPAFEPEPRVTCQVRIDNVPVTLREIRAPFWKMGAQYSFAFVGNTQLGQDGTSRIRVKFSVKTKYGGRAAKAQTTTLAVS